MRLVDPPRPWWRQRRWMDALLGPMQPKLEVSQQGPGKTRTVIDVPVGATHIDGPNGTAAEIRRGKGFRAPYELWINTGNGEWKEQPSGTWLATTADAA